MLNIYTKCVINDYMEESPMGFKITYLVLQCMNEFIRQMVKLKLRNKSLSFVETEKKPEPYRHSRQR